MTKNSQVPLWMEESDAVIDSSTPFVPGRNTSISGIDTTGIPRCGRVVSTFTSEGKTFYNIITENGEIYVVSPSVLNG